MTARPPRYRSQPLRTDGGSRVGAVLLAAGQSTRFEGENKLLAQLDGTPVVRHAAETLLDAAVSDIVVVGGHEATAVREALTELPVSVRTNPDYTAGQSTSVRTGVEAARERDWDTAVFALGDMPFVDPETVDALVERAENGDESVVAPVYDGQRGNPVLFEAREYEALRAVTGDEGGRQLLEQRADVALVDTDDPGVVQDIDVRADLSRG
jgi:molybdenum cofactor cytidylyltransferase